MGAARVIAIDGPVASGKSVVGRLVADRLGYRFVDTGVMYRAVTWAALQRKILRDDAKALGSLAHDIHIDIEGGSSSLVKVNGVDVTGHLRTRDVEDMVSYVSQVRAVREAMVEQQRRMAREGRTVMAGRDIGTAVLPDAPLKLFITASKAERAKRRFRELQARGLRTTMAEVRQNLDLRDRLDSERAESPLRQADDAVLLETDDLTIDQVVEHVLGLVGKD